MREVYIVGVGQTPVTKGTDQTIRQLGAQAVSAARESASVDDPTALYVGNMMSGMLSDQQQLGALISHSAGLPGIEAATVEAACGSGAAAARFAFMSVASAAHDVVIACGVERMTHAEKDKTTRALASASDWQLEGGQGETFVSLNARLMEAYLERYELDADALASFALVAHDNATRNPNALFHKQVDLEMYKSARQIHGPLRLFDVSPICDGSAAIVLACEEVAMKAKAAGKPVMRIRASAVATDPLSLVEREDMLELRASKTSALRAYAHSGLSAADIELFELHDAYTIMSALSLEAAGFAQPGTGYRLAQEGAIKLDGSIPITTMGGLKGRGHPVGATGIYQLVETFLQLARQAGDNQIKKDVRIGMTQNMGGTGATVVTHILERVD